MKDNSLNGSGLFAKGLIGNYGLMDISGFETVITRWILNASNTITPQPINIKGIWTSDDVWLETPYFYR